MIWESKLSFRDVLKAGTGITLGALMSAGFSSEARAFPVFFESDPIQPSYSNLGDSGLMQIPNARMMPDGEMGIGSGYVEPYRRHFINFQALPWLQGVFRYTAISGVPYSGAHQQQSYKDKSIDFKIRLLKERALFPETVIGFRDIGGTGLFQSEYLAFSKRYLNLDLTFGLGFGNLGTRGHLANPFRTVLGNSYASRTRGQDTGKLNNAFFKGERASFFGGIEYQTAYKPIRLKLEYEGNDYSKEPYLNKYITARTPFNYGIQYSPFSWFDFTIAYERGEKMMFKFNLKTNFNKLKPMPKFDEKPAPLLVVRAQGEIAGLPKNQIANDKSKTQIEKLFDLIESKGFKIDDLVFDDQIITLKITLIKDLLPSSADMALIAEHLFQTKITSNLTKVVFKVKGIKNDEILISYDQTELTHSKVLTGSPVALAPPLPVSWSFNLTAHNSFAQEQDLIDKIFTLEEQGLLIEKIFLEGESIKVKVSSNQLPTNTIIYDRIAMNLNKNFAHDFAEICFIEEDRNHKPTRTISRKIVPHYHFVALNNQKAGNLESKKSFSQDEIAKIADKVFNDLTQITFQGVAFDLKLNSAVLYFSQNVFRNPAIAVGRAGRIVASNVPPEIEFISLVIVKDGLATNQVTLMRTDLEKAALGQKTLEEMMLNAEIKAVNYHQSKTIVYNRKTYPKLDFGIEPKLRQHIGGGDNFYFWQVFGSVSSRLNLTRKWSLSGTLGFDVANNFKKMETYPSNSILPHVRSDIPRYIKDSKHWIDDLSINYITNLAPNWYARASGGIFEMMFAGFGGEILYRSSNRPFAVGLDVNRVRQRDYTGYFKMLDYQTTTGHLSFYNQWPVYNLETVVKIGRYLAKDQGATLEVSRKFDSGIIIGIFATKTNVSEEEFGEGSFDKGIFLTVPLDLFTTRSTTGKGNFLWRPLSRDGGQILAIPKPLYNVIAESSSSDLTKGWHEILK